MKKKVVGLFLVTALCLTTLVGCSQEFNVKVNTTPDGKTNLDITPVGDISDIASVMNEFNEQENDDEETIVVSNDDFDTSIYANTEWSLANVGGAEIIASNKLGNMYFVGVNNPAFVYLQFDFNETEITAEGKSLIYANAANGDSNLYYFDNTVDKTNPLQVYIPDAFITNLTSSPTQLVMEDNLTFVEYVESIEDAGKIYDICKVTGKNLYNSEDLITFDMYVDRETQSITKLVKEIDENNADDFSLQITIVNDRDFIADADFIENAKQANEQEEYTAYNADLFVALMMDGENAVQEMGELEDKLNVYTLDNYTEDTMEIEDSTEENVGE